MFACPPDEQLAALLETPPEIGLAELDTHISGCTDCQSRLDVLSEAPRLAAWLGDRSERAPGFQYLEPPTRPGDLGRIGRYSVEAELDRGGMGIVFRAWDEDLRRHVAVKVLRAGSDHDHAVARFVRESRAVAGLRHDHLLPVLDVVNARDGRLAIVMPLVRGPSLRDRVRRTSGLTPREAADFVRQIADALDAAHQAGIIHRDVKPGNVLIDSADGRAKLTDFGLARSTTPGDTLTLDGMLVGTPEYVSPEQASDPARTEVRSDLYSLGVVFYECLTGVVPFRGSPLEVINRHLTVEPVAPIRLNAGIPADLNTICMKCLEKIPSRRYDSAAALRDDLDRWQAGKPVRARPVGRAARAWRWAKRNPLAVAVVVASLLGSIGSATGWFLAQVRAKEAHNRQREADDARDLANERSMLALEAINTLVTKAQNLAGDQPGTLKLKQQLNEAALADLRHLTDAASKVPGADHTTIRVHLKLGDTFALLGQSEDALREWTLARDHSEKLLAESPADWEARRDRGRACTSIGNHRVRLLQFTAARPELEEAVSLVSEVVVEHPEDRASLDAMAEAYRGRGDLRWTTGNASAALTDYAASLEWNGRHLNLNPNNATVRSRMLLTNSRVGYVNIAMLHDYSAAKRNFREQQRLATEQLARTPSDPTWQRNARIVKLDLSSALQRQCEFAAAEKLALEAIPELEAAAAADPDHTTLQRDVASGYTHAGLAQIGAGRFADAEKSFTRSRSILEKIAARTKNASFAAADFPPLSYVLALACERQGRYTDAAMWMDHMIVEVRGLAEASGNTLQVLSILGGLAAHRDALRLVPEALQDSAIIANRKPEVAKLLAAYRTAAMARRSDVDLATARHEIATWCEKHPDSAALLSAKAVIEGHAAGRIANPAERQKCIESGASALIAAIRLDRTILEVMHVVPETALLRTSDTFKRELRRILTP